MKVKSLHTYPVKSMQACDLRSMNVDRKGPRHDRSWMVTDENYQFLTQRQKSQMARIQTEIIDGETLKLVLPDGTSLEVSPPQNTEVANAVIWKNDVAVFDAGEEAAAFMTAFLEEPCRLVYQSPEIQRPVSPKYAKDGDHVSLADEMPVLIVNMASLRALGLPDDITIDRFRGNIVLDGLEPFEEDDIHMLKIGDVELELVKPCARCIVTTKDQKSGEQVSKEPIETLAKLRRGTRGVFFGQYAIPRKLGVIKAGDKVEVLSRRSEPYEKLAPAKLKFMR